MKKEEKKQIDKMEYLEEVLTSMNESLKNLRKVKDEQTLLIEVIEASDKRDKFEQFIKESKDQIKNLEQQDVKLSEKIEALTNVISLCEDNRYVKDAINDFMTALGLFNA